VNEPLWIKAPYLTQFTSIYSDTDLTYEEHLLTKKLPNFYFVFLSWRVQNVYTYLTS